MSSGRWALIVLVVTLVGTAAVWLLQDRASRVERDAARSFRIGDERLLLPAAYFRPTAEDGAVELAAFFPGFAPAARYDDIDSRADIEDRFRRLVFVELRPADATVDPADRPARLYLRFLSPTSWSHPGGLVAREFEPGSPFEGDELFYLAPDGRDFAARCPKPDPDRKTPNTCMTVFRAGAIDAELRFSQANLSQWRELIDGARGLIETARR